MSNWRGGSRPAFPTHTSNDSSNTPSTRPTNPFPVNPLNAALHAITGRGRGRGRGSIRGLPSKRGGSNLSWKRPTEDTTLEEEGDESQQSEDTAEPNKSAFTAFGNSAGGSAFGSTSSFGGFNPTPSTSTSAFGSGGATTSAFGSNGSFGSTSSAFPPSSSTPSSFAPSTSSAFAPAPTHNSAPPANPTPFSASTPMERPISPETTTDAKRNPAQISTLEVLGEDSDARRKRFESTLPNNRYLELKPLREEQRLRAIKQGLIPDPSKPMRLAQATDFEGTCEEMCPEWEREEREYQNNVDPLERYPGTSRIDPSRAVKAFHRPAAGNDQPLPGDVRPPPILYKTLNYLFHTLLPQHTLAITHPFVRDRTRSVRQDFTVQNVRDKSAVECNERIARYHILALGTLREQTGFSESQELEQLRKVLKSLNEFYDDLRVSNPTLSLPNEAEFRSYHLLTHLRDPDIVWSTELLPLHIFSHPLLQTALQLHRLAQRSNTARGERASPNAFSRFFKLVESPQVPYLFGCILSTHFNEIRKNALDALRGAYLKQHSAFPLRTLTKILGCDDEAETRSVCEQLGIVVRTDERGKLVAELHKGVVLKSTTLKLRVSKRLVEAKRGSTSYQSVIDGSNYSSQSVPAIPMTPALTSGGTFASAQAQHRPQPALSAPSFSASTKPAFPGFAPISAPPTAFPTPVPTPPPFVSSSATSTTPSLNAAASSFVPSFGTNSQTTSAPPPTSAFSFAPSSTQAPSVPVQSTPSFSFAPTATPFVPSTSLPPPAANSAPPPNFFAPPSSKAAPPPLLSPIPLKVSSPTIPSALSPKLTRATVSPSLRRISSTLSRISPKLSPPKPPPVPKVDRKPLIDSLVRSLTQELLLDAIKGPVRRAGQDALKERWAVVSAKEEKANELMSDEIAREVIEELGRMFVKECVVQVGREERIKREAVAAWRERTRDQKRRRKEGEERQREWEEVMKGLGEQVRRSVKEDEDEMSDEEIFVEEEEEAGVAGNGVVDFEFGGLSLGLVEKPIRQRMIEQEQDDMAGQLRSAAETRRRIWANRTFLDILASHLSASFGHRRLPSRPTWTTILSTPSTESSFATWLSCKFDLDDEKRVEVDSVDVKLSVQMLEHGEELEQDDLDSTGLILFDCTALPSVETDWEESRNQLRTLVENVDQDSLYRPSLLVLFCPNHVLSVSEEAELQKSISEHLDVSSLSTTIVQQSIIFVKLDGAESSFDVETAKLLSSISIREERVRRPLTSYSKPLLATWRTSVSNSLNRYQRDEIASTLVSTYIDELQEILTEIESAAHPSIDSVSLPSFPDGKESFRSTVESYVSEKAFSKVGNFPEIATAFAQRPPLSDHNLARLLFDLLEQFATRSYSSDSTTLQLSLDENLKPTLRRIEDSLIEVIQLVHRAADEEAKKQREKESKLAASKKKRKASITPSDSPNRSPKKVTVNSTSSKRGNDNSSQDRLSALELLMKETKALLST